MKMKNGIMSYIQLAHSVRPYVGSYGTGPDKSACHGWERHRGWTKKCSTRIKITGSGETLGVGHVVALKRYSERDSPDNSRFVVWWRMAGYPHIHSINCHLWRVRAIFIFVIEKWVKSADGLPIIGSFLNVGYEAMMMAKSSQLIHSSFDSCVRPARIGHWSAMLFVRLMKLNMLLQNVSPFSDGVPTAWSFSWCTQCILLLILRHCCWIISWASRTGQYIRKQASVYLKH